MNQNNNVITIEEISSHLMNDEHPSDYFNSLSEEVISQYPLSMLNKLKKVEQSAKYHPEGNVWNHTMMVLDEAALVREQTNDDRVFMWAALLHDIGKPDTTRNRKGRITSYNHDAVGAKLCSKFLEFYTDDEVFINKVAMMVKYHMHMLYVLKNLPFGNRIKMISDTDIHDLALLCRCDRLGRIGADKEEETNNYYEFLKRCQVPL